MSEDKQTWRRFGFANSEKKWLTLEKVGENLNANGAALKAKQVWVMELDERAEAVYIKNNSRNLYLCTDKLGNLMCKAEEKAAASKFTIEYNDQGQWAMKCTEQKLYIAGKEDKIDCGSKTAVWWYCQLAIHPQVNLYNNVRRRYCHMEEDEVHCTKNVPWGSQAIFTLDYVSDKQKYRIKTSDQKYLNPDGSLQVMDCSKSSSEGACYTIQLKSPGLAFRHENGKFLTNVGPNATLKVRTDKVGKDEVFQLKDSHPQVILQGSNSKRVSITQGVDLSANQDQEDITDKEIFQLEFDAQDGKCKFLASNQKYWVNKNSGIQATKDDGSSSDSLFEMEQLDNSRVILKSEGKYVTIKQTGALSASASALEDGEKFKMTILNRPIVILKGNFGFVGLKGSNVDSTSPKWYPFELIQTHDGMYKFKGANGGFWSLDGSNQVICSVATEDEGTGFQLQLLGNSKLHIKTASGEYLGGNSSGALSVVSETAKLETKTFEF